MAVDASLAGRTFPPTEPYAVTEEAVAAFAAATGTPYAPGGPAPATFPIVVAFGAMQALMQNPDVGIQLVWVACVAIIAIAILLRDGVRGRSIGKQLLGLRMITPRGEKCGYLRSIVRNLPLLIPGWNLVEVVLVLAGKPRTGDRIARTTIAEE